MGALASPLLIPARILNEHVYCPRLAYLEWVDRRFIDNEDTVHGRWVHRVVDRERGDLGVPESTDLDGGVGLRATSLIVGSEDLGLIARIDLVETREGAVIPVEFKRGAPVTKDAPLNDPERVQLCAQAMLLRAHGYRVEQAEAYFAETRERIVVELDDELEDLTLRAITSLRQAAASEEPPPPLIDSPKCVRCSLSPLCLPDEVNLLRDAAPGPPRRLVAKNPSSAPLYATSPGSKLIKRGERVLLREKGQVVAERRLLDVSHIAVFGNVDISSALLRECFDRSLPVLWLTHSGWLSGVASGVLAGSVELRVKQHRASIIGAPRIAREFVAGKIRNQRTLLRRNGAAGDAVLRQLRDLVGRAEECESVEMMLGIEGTAARIYFGQFSSMLRGNVAFDFNGRNRRPPRDRVNALLSFVYGLLVKDTLIAALAAGLDPYIGLMHVQRFGRPSLALDLAEEFRPLIADSVVMTLINNGEVGDASFIERAGSVGLTVGGRRAAMAAYERRMAETLRHPVFGYPAVYRRILEIQARLLAATLSGDVPRYRPLTTR